MRASPLRTRSPPAWTSPDPEITPVGPFRETCWTPDPFFSDTDPVTVRLCLKTPACASVNESNPWILFIAEATFDSTVERSDAAMLPVAAAAP